MLSVLKPDYVSASIFGRTTDVKGKGVWGQRNLMAAGM